MCSFLITIIIMKLSLCLTFDDLLTSGDLYFQDIGYVLFDNFVGTAL